MTVSQWHWRHGLNLFAASESLEGAAEILDDAENELRTQWKLKINDDSRELLVAKNGNIPNSFQENTRWKLKSNMKTLGHMISNDGSIEPGWDRAKSSIWKGWWGNLSKKQFRGAVDQKVMLLTRTASGIVSYHCLLWPWSASTAKRIDNFQAYLVTKCLDTEPTPNESNRVYWQRRTLIASNACRRKGLWSKLWSKRLASWSQHLQRHQECWITRLLKTRNLNWLAQRRRQFAHLNSKWNEFRGRTDTRMAAEKVQKRWQQGWKDWRTEHPNMPA